MRGLSRGRWMAKGVSMASVIVVDWPHQSFFYVLLVECFADMLDTTAYRECKN
jgi:hypothetical protein